MRKTSCLALLFLAGAAFAVDRNDSNKIVKIQPFTRWTFDRTEPSALDQATAAKEY